MGSGLVVTSVAGAVFLLLAGGMVLKNFGQITVIIQEYFEVWEFGSLGDVDGYYDRSCRW
jgi:hypothetical protein